MSNDLQADITTKLKGQGLTQAASGVTKLKTETQALTTANKDLQRTAGRALGAIKSDASGAQKEVSRLAMSLSTLKGPLGDVARKSFAAFRVGGVLGLAAGGAVAGTLLATGALKIYNMVVDTNIEKTKKQIDQQKLLDVARENASKAADKEAAGAGRSHAQDIRLATARLGPEGVNRARELAENNIAGIDMNEALKGNAAASLLPKAIQGRAMDAAQQVAATGEMSYSAALKAIGADRFLQQRLSGSNGMLNTGEVGDRLIVGARGQDATDANLQAARTARQRVADPTLRGPGALNAVNKQEGLDAELAGAQLDQFLTGRSLESTRTDIERTRNPEAAAGREVLKQILKANQEALEIQRAAGPLYNRMYRVLESLNLKLRIGGEGLPSAKD